MIKDKRTLIDRDSVTLWVRGRAFSIGFISNYMMRTYDKIVQESSRVYTLYLQYQKAEKDKNVSRMAELEEAIRETKEKDFTEKRLDLIKEILTRNNLKFDYDFWDRETGPDDLMTFLRDAISKDLSKKEKKKGDHH